MWSTGISFNSILRITFTGSDAGHSQVWNQRLLFVSKSSIFILTTPTFIHPMIWEKRQIGTWNRNKHDYRLVSFNDFSQMAMLETPIHLLSALFILQLTRGNQVKRRKRHQLQTLAASQMSSRKQLRGLKISCIWKDNWFLYIFSVTLQNLQFLFTYFTAYSDTVVFGKMLYVLFLKIFLKLSAFQAKNFFISKLWPLMWHMTCSVGENDPKLAMRR